MMNGTHVKNGDDGGPAIRTGWGCRRADIDLGLAVLGVVNRGGRKLSFAEIADVCGCHRSLIEQIEKRALAKLRGRLRRSEFLMGGDK